MNYKEPDSHKKINVLNISFVVSLLSILKACSHSALTTVIANALKCGTVCFVIVGAQIGCKTHTEVTLLSQSCKVHTYIC